MLNVAVLTGRFVADPELRYTPNNVAVTSFTIAVNRSFAKQGADRQTDFIDIVAWRSTAEFVCKYFKKGSLISIQGSIQTRTYEDKQGNKRKAVEIVADNVHFVESKSSSSESANYHADTSGDTGSQAFASGDVEDFVAVEDDADLPF